MDDSTAILVGLALAVVLIVSLMFFVIPEPAQRAIVATDRLDLAVLSFRNSSTWEGVDETVRARVESTLVNEPGINVFSRAQIDSLLAEQMMSESGLIDATTAVKLGSLTGVSKLITGSIHKRVSSSAQSMQRDQLQSHCPLRRRLAGLTACWPMLLPRSQSQ